MNIEFFLYLTDMLPSLSMGFVLIGGIGLIILAAVTAMLAMDCYDYKKDFKSRVNHFGIIKIFWLLITLLLTSCLIPDQKTMYLMLGANYLKDSQLPHKVELLLTKKLDEYLMDVKKETKHD